jgi:anti-sigma factor RsiW
MERSISERDITEYVLNELQPRERLYVESMMLGCDRSREEVVAVMELSRLLEEGMSSELACTDLSLDARRREKIFSTDSQNVWKSVGQLAAAGVALAACLAFSVAAPVISKAAFRPDSAKSQLARQGSLDDLADVVDPAAFPVALFESEETVQSSNPDEFPTHVLLPTGTVNLGEMPMPYLGGELN